jgi:hypothetical protein
MRHRTAAFALLAFLAAAAQAAEPAKPGKGPEYIVGSGPGVMECTRFVEALAKARTAPSPEAQGFALYVAGFQTAYNLQTPETCDIFAGMNADQVLARVEDFCKANPQARFGAGVIALAKERYPLRSKTCK